MKNNKKLLTILIIWIFIHLLIYTFSSKGDAFGLVDYFYPFLPNTFETSNGIETFYSAFGQYGLKEYDSYDHRELFVYLGSAITFYLLYLIFKKRD
jgi:hypothetical protein